MEVWIRDVQQESSGGIVPYPLERECPRDRIGTAAAQWLAAGEPPQCQRAATRRAEAGDRDARVVRAARVEPAARAEQWTESALVEGKQGEYQSGHV